MLGSKSGRSAAESVQLFVGVSVSVLVSPLSPVILTEMKPPSYFSRGPPVILDSGKVTVMAPVLTGIGPSGL